MAMLNNNSNWILEYVKVKKVLKWNKNSFNTKIAKYTNINPLLPNHPHMDSLSRVDKTGGVEITLERIIYSIEVNLMVFSCVLNIEFRILSYNKFNVELNMCYLL